MEAIGILQPVTPMDDKHPAHWYNTPGMGQRILTAQSTFLVILKLKLSQCRSKNEVGFLLNCHNTPNWPVYKKPSLGKNHTSTNEVEEMIKNNTEYWTIGFGGVVRVQWYEMIQKFADAINAMN